jgi:hypothetical protein
MSIFQTLDVPCPTCAAAVSFDLVHSVNADRRADLRQAILDRSFQRQTCPSCGLTFRVEPEFTYINLKRGQYVAVWPISKRAQFKALEARSRAAFDKAFGSGAPPEAQALGKKVAMRMVFGWPALNEKLIAAENGIDDRSLELAKVGIVRNLDEVPVGDEMELRLVAVMDGELKLGWIRARSDELADVIGVPRAVIGEVEADPEGWAALREDVVGGAYVDYARGLIAA